ncbi:hypothetical protein KIMH_09730 [Bombiscardovia apis]|uniref:Uncharacterized protein n=1 Tax=Bombiscardovia apis TaxID=2932182 RepID=A0ABN6SHV1_9BIFI|nr:hypothetical protein [Bombiscardovia apis]BDR54862.1 hypothetical protein KIMH_09730 [Bombiscardovia apis]
MDRSRKIADIESFWSIFMRDLDRVFEGSGGPGSNVYLSSPYEYYILQESDFSFLQEEIKRQWNTSEKSFNSFYLSRICIMAFQYSQMKKSSLNAEFPNYKSLLSELAYLSPRVSAIKPVAIERFTEKLMESLL